MSHMRSLAVPLLWYVVLIATIAAILAGGLLFQLAGRWIDARRYPPTGRLVDIGGRRLHAVDNGAGSPAVILESGIAATALSWSLVQPEVAKFTRVCSYDRAGLGWSDAGLEPRTLNRSIDDLHSLLGAMEVAPPYVLVGHSYGSLLVRAYAACHPASVGGIVLVDPVSISDWSAPSQTRARMLARGARLSRRGALLARLGLVRFALVLLLSGRRGFPKLIAKFAGGRSESVVSRLVGEVGKLPPECWPMVRSHWCDPKCFAAMAGYLECLPANTADFSKMSRMPYVPLAILSAANATAAELEEREDLARSVPGATHTIAARSGHWIPFDEPDLVVSTIRTIAGQARLHQALRGPQAR